MDRKVRAYTLLELVTIMLIGILISYLAVNEIINHIQEARLREAHNQLLSDLNYIKNQALVTGLPWGLRACAGGREYKIFIDHDSNCKDTSVSCSDYETTKICLNILNKVCYSDQDCLSQQGACVPRSLYNKLPPGITFTNSSYVVFNKLGYAFNYLCGNGEGSFILQNTNRKFITINISRTGRIR
ncbi:MAG: hypothetical protein N2327_00370 [Caldimicrobium sp.]|nr:hypothetical protein [Caldimicrobium sp.]MCX7872882.1 hypothetical protein [Caldimicrobium sp.]MDW8093540.1 hypothetical protein [Caldimicrobium sp.]